MWTCVHALTIIIGFRATMQIWTSYQLKICYFPLHVVINVHYIHIVLSEFPVAPFTKMG